MRRLSPILLRVGAGGWAAGVLLPATCEAHTPAGPTTFPELVRTWGTEPGSWIILVLALLLYTSGTGRLWSRMGVGRGIRLPEFWSYMLGWLVLAFALVSPLHPLGGILFSAHMTQHELLMLLAAPLMVLGRPVIAYLWGLPGNLGAQLNRTSTLRPLRSLGGQLANPFVAWLLHAIVLWSWHLPFLFQATLRSEWVHGLQHFSFFSSALLFWWALFRGHRRVLGYGMAVLYLFTTALHSGLLGALLTFARSVWYPVYSDTYYWGLTPLEDQQLGGLIMWVPAGLVYIVAALYVFTAWLRESELRARALETNRGPTTPSGVLEAPQKTLVI